MTLERVPSTAAVGDCDESVLDASPAIAFARPKSSTLTLPSGVSLMLAFDRNIAAQLGVGGAVDDAHPASTDLLDQRVVEQ